MHDAAKNDLTLRMWLLGNAWKFWRQILYACSAELCPVSFNSAAFV